MNNYHRKFTKASILSIDTETTGLLPWIGDCPYAINFLNCEGESLYYDWSVDPFTREVLADPEELEICAEILGSERIQKILFNAKFDT